MSYPGRKMTGFTLIELMVTLAVVTIVVTTAVPAFKSMVANNRIAAQTNEIVGAIQYARSEAAKLHKRVILCRSANPTAATPSCGGTANNWTTGWLLFASGDANSTYESANDTLLRVGPPSRGIIQIRTNSTSNNNLEINADGTTNENGGTAVFALCDDRNDDGDYDEQYGRQVQVSPVGHVKLIRGPIPNCQSPYPV